jgi:prevent-host-death family protein
MISYNMAIGDSHMNGNKIAIAEGKRDFTRIVKRISEKAEDIIITRRGEPVAALIPYRDYQEALRLRSYLKMLKLSKSTKKYGITAGQIQEAIRKELDDDPGRH